MGNNVVQEATTTSWSMVPPELGNALVKVAVFAVVQALVYLILRKSSGLFAPAPAAGKTAAARSFSFRPMRSMSVRRVLAAFSDVPVGVPESPEDGGAAVAAPSPVDVDPAGAEMSLLPAASSE